MDFTYSEEQTLLKNSVERFIADHGDFTKRLALIDSEAGFSRDHWSLFAEQGWLALPFAEDVGGLDFGLPELMIVMEALGAGLVTEPYVPTVVLGGGAVRLAGTPDQQTEVLPGLIGGGTLLAFAHQEAGFRHDPAGVAMDAKPDGDGYTLNGRKRLVLHGPTADKVVVTARTGGTPGETDGLTLFLIDGQAPGLGRRAYRTVDGLPAADLDFDNVKADADSVLGEPGAAFETIDTLIGEANVALLAEAVGAMTALFEATRDYVATRKQFRRAIGSFQVVQHRMADAFMDLEQSIGMLYRAALTANRPRSEWLRNVSAAKAFITEASRRMGHTAIQLHGGIGMTHELVIGHYHKRLLMIQSLFGDAAWHRAQFRVLGRTE